jgi:hypothetical protein
MSPLRIASGLALSLALFGAADARASEVAEQWPVAAAPAETRPEATEPVPARPRADSSPRPTEPKWYGWQTLALDAALVAADVVYAERGHYLEGWFVYGTLAAFALGAPAIHLAHGEWQSGLLSLGARTLVPLATFGLMSIPGCDPAYPDEPCMNRNAYRAILTIASGLIVALADGAGLAFERPKRPATTAITVVPWIDGQTKGAAFAMTF